jgi:transcriptional regulator with XRE-family HTH domain
MHLNLCKHVQMPNVDEIGKRWQESGSERVGAAIKHLRRVRGMTAVDLAERTKQLGYPVTRVAITKIENNTRSGKLDVAELLVIAAALGVPPILLLYPVYPYGAVEVLPLPGGDGRSSQFAALRWFAGEQNLREIPGQDDEFSIAAVDLIVTTRQRHMLQSAMMFGGVDVLENPDDPFVAAKRAMVQTVTKQNDELGRKAARLWERIHGEPAPTGHQLENAKDNDA